MKLDVRAVALAAGSITALIYHFHKKGYRR